jgi:hypothetical protein
VTKVEAGADGPVVGFEGGSAPATDTFDRILVAVGRKPNGRLIGAENAGVVVDEATHRVVGRGIVGPSAGDLIAEAALAVEMGADAADLGPPSTPDRGRDRGPWPPRCMHEGTITDLIAPKKRRRTHQPRAWARPSPPRISRGRKAAIGRCARRI